MQYLYPLKISSQLAKEIRLGVRSWKRFCQKPISDKIRFKYNENHHGDTGYEIKIPNQNSKLSDYKENFHLNLDDYSRLSIVDKNKNKFIENIPKIIDLLEPIALNHASYIEKRTNCQGIYSLQNEVIMSKPYWIIRYLHYHKPNQDQTLAKAHIDKDGFTIHLYESEPGLEILTLDRVWTPISNLESTRPINNYIMNGAQMQLATNCNQKAIAHRVVNRTGRSRFAMVCFIPFFGCKRYNKTKYGSMQSHEPGFNYDLSPEKYGDYFSSEKYEDYFET